MKFLQFVWADERPSAEEIATMNRDLPAFDEEMDSRGVRLFGRELDFPETAATVRVRDDQVLVTDGPFAETKEFIAGFDLLQCSDLDEAIEVTAQNPIAWFHPMELRPVLDEVEMTEALSAFGRGEDGKSRPFLLGAWSARSSAEAVQETTIPDEIEAWRRAVEASGRHLLGSRLGGSDSATTIRVQAGQTSVHEGSFSRIEELVTTVEVVSCADRDRAIELAGAYPLARHAAIEVRPFYVG